MDPQPQAPTTDLNDLSGYRSIPENDFIGSLKNPTEGDQRQVNNPQQPSPPKPSPKETDLIARMAVSVVDVVMQVGCTVIADEPDVSLFKVSDAQKKQIEEPLADLLEYYKIHMNPVFLLVLAIVAVYAPVTMKAVSIGRKKKEIKKAAVAQARGEKVTMPDPIVIKPGPGRPPGTTKENLAAKKEADQKK